jgi:hypothetical protein
MPGVGGMGRMEGPYLIMVLSSAKAQFQARKKVQAGMLVNLASRKLCKKRQTALWWQGDKRGRN